MIWHTCPPSEHSCWSPYFQGEVTIHYYPNYFLPAVYVTGQQDYHLTEYFSYLALLDVWHPA